MPSPYGVAICASIKHYVPIFGQILGHGHQLQSVRDLQPRDGFTNAAEIFRSAPRWLAVCYEKAGNAIGLAGYGVAVQNQRPGRGPDTVLQSDSGAVAFLRVF